MGWFQNRLYNTAEVIKETIYDTCDIIKSEEYYIEYTTVYIGFIKAKEKFFELHCGMGDCFTRTVKTLTEKKLIEKFDKFLVENRKTRIEKEKLKIQLPDCKDRKI